MSVRDHRDERAAKRAKRRMPKPQDFCMGTRAFETDRYDHDDDELEVAKCACCHQYFSITELDDDGICEECAGKEDSADEDLT